MEIAEPFLKTCMEEASDHAVTAEDKTKAKKKTILTGKHLTFSCVVCAAFSFQVIVIAKKKFWIFWKFRTQSLQWTEV